MPNRTGFGEEGQQNPGPWRERIERSRTPVQTDAERLVHLDPSALASKGRRYRDPTSAPPAGERLHRLLTPAPTPGADVFQRSRGLLRLADPLPYRATPVLPRLDASRNVGKVFSRRLGGSLDRRKVLSRSPFSGTVDRITQMGSHIDRFGRIGSGLEGAAGPLRHPAAPAAAPDAPAAPSSTPAAAPVDSHGEELMHLVRDLDPARCTNIASP